MLEKNDAMYYFISYRIDGARPVYGNALIDVLPMAWVAYHKALENSDRVILYAERIDRDDYMAYVNDFK